MTIQHEINSSEPNGSKVNPELCSEPKLGMKADLSPYLACNRTIQWCNGQCRDFLSLSIATQVHWVRLPGPCTCPSIDCLAECLHLD